MAKNNVIAPEEETLGEAMSKTEHFFENNGKKLIFAIIALVALALVVFGYKSIIMEPKANQAAELLYKAQALLESETPDYQLALTGDEATPGFLEVADNYGSTPSGNLAKHYAGVCYLHTGDMEAAANYLASYKAVKGVVGSVINAQNYALQGDIAVEADDFKAAIKLYRKAVNASENPLTAPAYLFKAALASIAADDAAGATAIFTEITTSYPNTDEAARAEKYLVSMK